MTEALSETSALLRETVRGRFVASDSYHVTLAFLGDVNTSDTYRILDSMQRALDEADLLAATASLGRFGCFGKRTRATLWQGFEKPGPLHASADAVRHALRSEGIPFDEKRFLPHVTLMRAANLSIGVLPSPHTAEGLIDAITLFRSDLSGKHPVYEPLSTFMLDRH